MQNKIDFGKLIKFAEDYFFIVLTICWIVLVCFINDFRLIIKLKPNEFGDFFAGVFAPLAFFWFLKGYFLQAREIQRNREEVLEEKKSQRLSAQPIFKFNYIHSSPYYSSEYNKNVVDIFYNIVNLDSDITYVEFKFDFENNSFIRIKDSINCLRLDHANPKPMNLIATPDIPIGMTGSLTISFIDGLGVSMERKFKMEIVHQENLPVVNFMSI